MPADDHEDMRIILVDDHGPFRIAARRLLEAENCLVVAEAVSGEHALTQVRGTVADIVLVDVFLPGIDGFATARQLAAGGDGPQVVLISSRPLADIGSDRVAGCGARGFVHKAELSRAALDSLVA
jgi:DNA-binding NarL/FixJ family response regulator